MAAACLAAIAIGVGLLTPREKEQVAILDTRPEVTANPEADTLVVTPPVLASAEPVSASEKKSTPAGSVDKKVRNQTKVSGTETEQSVNGAQDAGNEITEYIASNYRVIDDPGEARAFVGELFAVMESNLLIEQSRVADVYDNMHFELTNCCVQMQ